MAYQTGTLAGTYNKPDASRNGRQGHIIPSVPIVRDTTGNVVISGTVVVEYDDDGSFRTPLAASDDLTLDPSGVTYTFDPRLKGHQPITGIFIPAGMTVQVADVTPVNPLAPSYAVNGVLSVAGRTGTITVAELTADLGLAKFIPHQNTPPADPNVTPAYVDTSTAPPTVKGWNGAAWVPIGGTSTGGVTVQDEGVALSTDATVLNFTGSGVTATGTTGTKTITIAGGTSGVTVQDEGTSLSAAGTTLNFVGSGVAATGTGATKTITVSGGGSAITVQDEGTPLATDATTLNFTGAAVTASGTGGTKTITVSNLTGETVNTVAASGAAVTLPAPTGATVNEITLTADCAITLPSGFDATKEYSILVWFNQPAAGGSYVFNATWVGTIAWLDGGTPPIVATGQSAVTGVTLFTKDGGTTWRGSASVVDPGNQGVTLTIDGSGNVAVPAGSGDVFDLTLTRNVTIAAPSGLTKNKKLLFRIKQDATGGRTITWNAAYRWSTTVPVVFLSTSGNKTDYVGGIYDAADSKVDMIGTDVGH